MRHHITLASPKVTTVLRFATTPPPIPVTVDTFETRGRQTSLKVTRILGFATTTPPIPVTVDAFETRRRKTSPKATTVLGFATLIRLLTLETRRRHASPKATTVLHFARMPASTRGLRTGDRLRTLRTDLALTPNPQSPSLETRTLLPRMRKM